MNLSSLFIERTHICDAAGSAEQAFKVPRAFGWFQTQLADLPTPRLQDTIPDFHHTPKRFAALEQAIASDPVGQDSGIESEVIHRVTAAGY